MINQHLISLSSSSLSSSSSAIHNSPGRHGPLGFFRIFRLRITLYFICILAITTTLYCLVSYKPNGLPSSAYNSPHPIILSSSKQILDNIEHILNRNYLEYVRFKTTTVPINNSNIVSIQNLHNHDELSKIIFMIENLTTTHNCCNDDQQQQQQEQYPFKLVNNAVGLQSNSDNDNNHNNIEYLEYDDFDDEDSNKVEYHLKNLGFNLKHIIYLYALSHPNNVSMKSSILSSLQPIKTTATSSVQNLNEKLLKSNAELPSIKPLTIEIKPHQERTSSPSSLNISGLLSEEFLNSIIFITAINSNQFQLGQKFIKSFENFRRAAITSQQRQHRQHKNHSFAVDSSDANFVLMIYDLGLYPEQLSNIEMLCRNDNDSNHSNGSKKLCDLRTFQYDIYPSHVSDLRMAAYRSIILQEMLRDIKFTTKYHKRKDENVTLFWLDPQYCLIESKHQMVLQLQEETINHSGILSWPIEQPTSALTHPRMFEYFHTTKENFYFHRMIRPGHLMISLTHHTWEPFGWGIMLPWVSCALTSNCIAPLGSQWRSTCRLDRKPHYRYSGCHHYDMSVLNVVLGIAFNYSSSQYSAHLSKRFFAPINKLMLDDENGNDDENFNTNKDDIDDTFSLSMDGSYEYQFEDESKVSGRFDLVLTDDDIPDDDQLTPGKSSKNHFLFSFTSSSPSSSSSP